MNGFFIRTIVAIKKNLQSYLNEKFKELNLSSSEIFIMHLLYIENSPSQSKLAHLLECDKSHVNRITSKLIDKNLICYSNDQNQNDKHIRNIGLKLTPLGESHAKKFDHEIKKSINMLNSGITKEEEEITKRVLLKMLNNSYSIKQNGEIKNV